MKEKEDLNQDLQELVDYIRENKSSFGIEKLRKGLLSQGVEYHDIKKALEILEEEEEEKIAGFLNEDDEDLDGDVVVESDFSGGKGDHYKKKAGKIINRFTDTVGISVKNRKIYLDIIKYGAVSFLFFSLIVYFFKYLGGAYVYPRMVDSLGVMGVRALPDVFFIGFNIWELLLAILWSLVLGGALSLVFFKFLAKIWPFSIWFKLQQKLFVFYIIFEFLFSLFINGILSAFSWVYLLGYLIVLVGVVLASYLVSYYLSGVLESKYGDEIRKITR